MKRLFFVAAMLVCALSSVDRAVAQVPEDPLLWSIRSSLAMSRHPRHLAPMLAEVERNPTVRNQAMFDFIAELLVDTSGDAEYPEQSATDIATMMLRMKSGRYREAAIAVTGRTPYPKVRRLAQQYAVKHRKTRDPQYAPGTIDLPALRQKFIADALAFQPTPELARRIDQLPVGSKLESLFAVAGRPQFVDSTQWRIRDEVDIRVEKLFFYYRGIGRVTFEYSDEAGWYLRSFIADSLAWEPLMPYRVLAPASGLIDGPRLDMTRVLSPHSIGVRYALEEQYDRKSVPLEFLDSVAELLLQSEAGATHPVVIDTQAWMCRLLAEKGGRRYARVLGTIARGAHDEKVKGYARVPILVVEGVPTEAYQPGSVSLVSQREKFPPLYADAYVNGGL